MSIFRSIVYLLIFEYLVGSIANYFKNTSMKYNYLGKILLATFLKLKNTIWIFWVRSIISSIFRLTKVIHTIKFLILSFYIALINFFITIISIYQLIDNALVII